jgi:hypothetical protein
MPDRRDGKGGRPCGLARWAAAMPRNGLDRSSPISPIQRSLTSVATAAIAARIMAPSLMASRYSSSPRSALVDQARMLVRWIRAYVRKIHIQSHQYAIFVPIHERDIGVRTSPESLIDYRGRSVARVSQEPCYLNG